MKNVVLKYDNICVKIRHGFTIRYKTGPAKKYVFV